MEAQKLKYILEKHRHWLNKDCNGWQWMIADLSRADLSRADLSRACLRKANLSEADLSGAYLRGAHLSRADLSRADLSRADLSEADLSGAYLRGADLSRADLSEADLSEADLSEANLKGANLTGANLTGAYLTGAYLKGADLSGANLRGIDISDKTLQKILPICCPEYGSFIGWKKAGGYLGGPTVVIKLQITEDAKRSSATGRKCRCSKAVVLGFETIDGKKAEITEISSFFDRNFIYRLGETVEVKDFDEDRKNECAPGIHFFITRQEAVDY